MVPLEVLASHPDGFIISSWVLGIVFILMSRDLLARVLLGAESRLLVAALFCYYHPNPLIQTLSLSGEGLFLSTLCKNVSVSLPVWMALQVHKTNLAIALKNY